MVLLLRGMLRAEPVLAYQGAGKHCSTAGRVTELVELHSC
jgi:hypothetical protein